MNHVKDRALAAGARLVVKVGSSLVTNDGHGLDLAAIAAWASQLVALQQRGLQLVLVSSGAVAEGVARLGLPARPRRIHMQQAAAAVGQMGLIQAYEAAFAEYGRRAAQILLSHEDLSDRTRYLNARSTLATLLNLATLPVVNENDTVATAELCFGDNDTLAALVANLVNAARLVILSDQDGLFSADPRRDSQATLIPRASAHDGSLTAMAGVGSVLGRGGMRSKLAAARLAARSGTDTVIANGRAPQVLLRIAAGEPLGTFLSADAEPVVARKQWLAAARRLRGELRLDDGAVRVLRESGRSLLAVGISSASGDFVRGDVVACCDGTGREIGRGLINYSLPEVRRIMGRSSADFEALLGYAGEDEVIHRDNLLLT